MNTLKYKHSPVLSSGEVLFQQISQPVWLRQHKDNSNPSSLFRTAGVPRRAQGVSQWLNWLVGYLSSPSYRAAKGLPGTRAQPFLYCWDMMYMVTSHHICHFLGIWYDAFDVMFRATTIGRKPPTSVYQPATAKPVAEECRNQGLEGLDYRYTGISSVQR